MKRFTRQEIIERLDATLDKKSPIIIGSAAVGLVAKVIDTSGIDLIMIYCTGAFRIDGYLSVSGYFAYNDANATTRKIIHHIRKQVKNTPVIAGVSAADPYMELDEYVDELLKLGISGVTNVPTVGDIIGNLRQTLDNCDFGLPAEVDMIKKCHERDLFTVAYAHSLDDMKKFIDAGVDMIGIHVGGTIGGMMGEKPVLSIEDACAKSQLFFEEAKKLNPNVYVVTHGGPFNSPESLKPVFENTDVQGFIGASAIERIPIERAVAQTVRDFKALKMR